MIFSASYVILSCLCSAHQPEVNVEWVDSYRKLEIISPDKQDVAYKILAERRFAEISLIDAIWLSEDASIDMDKSYYIAEVGYFGDRHINDVPNGVVFGVDITANGEAYVVSHRLTSSNNISSTIVMLSTDDRIRHIISKCSSTS